MSRGGNSRSGGVRTSQSHCTTLEVAKGPDMTAPAKKAQQLSKLG